MAECAACGKALRKGAYSWTIGWSIAERAGKKDFDVRFHNTPDCIGMMTQRMDDYAWDQKMVDMLEKTGITFGFEDDEIEDDAIEVYELDVYVPNKKGK